MSCHHKENWQKSEFRCLSILWKTAFSADSFPWNHVEANSPSEKIQQRTRSKAATTSIFSSHVRTPVLMPETRDAMQKNLSRRNMPLGHFERKLLCQLVLMHFQRSFPHIIAQTPKAYEWYKQANLGNVNGLVWRQVFPGQERVFQFYSDRCRGSGWMEPWNLEPLLLSEPCLFLPKIRGMLAANQRSGPAEVESGFRTKSWIHAWPLRSVKQNCSHLVHNWTFQHLFWWIDTSIETSLSVVIVAWIQDFIGKALGIQELWKIMDVNLDQIKMLIPVPCSNPEGQTSDLRVWAQWLKSWICAPPGPGSQIGSQTRGPNPNCNSKIYRVQKSAWLSKAPSTLDATREATQINGARFHSDACAWCVV